MQVSRDNNTLRISASNYAVSFPPDRPFIYLDDGQGRRLAELFILSSVHPLSGRDDTTQIGTWMVEEGPEETVFTLAAGSSAWERKRYRVRCRPGRFVYDLEVEGRGQLADVEYFGGYASALPRWGSGRFWSGGRFSQGFTPEPNTAEAHYFPPGQGAVIVLLGGPLPGKGHWFFTPPPFCFAFQTGMGWVGMGVEAMPGGNRFTEYRYLTQLSGFALSLSYEGYTSVAGRYVLPGIGFDFGSSEWDVLAAHAEALRAGGMVPSSAAHSEPKPSPAPLSPSEAKPAALGRDQPAWWREPIFCGWGAQVGLALANLSGPPAPAYSTQANYERFLASLDEHGIDPGTIVLDDKWQASYGDNRVDEDKWPDLAGFIGRQHARGRRVLLWLKAWDPEGIPDGECIISAAGARLSFDPSNPAFLDRLRESVRRMLGTGGPGATGYNADGFKIDFTARIPSGPGFRRYGDTWGLEMMKLYLATLYDEAKRTKPDALVITHTPHPYLADVVDMIRLNDTLDLNLLDEFPIGLDLVKVMAARARVARIACPAALIDTDNWPVRDRATWREYVRRQPELGIPSLYFTTHVDLTGERLEESDYRMIGEAWAAYRASVQP